MVSRDWRLGERTARPAMLKRRARADGTTVTARDTGLGDRRCGMDDSRPVLIHPDFRLEGELGSPDGRGRRYVAAADVAQVRTAAARRQRCVPLPVPVGFPVEAAPFPNFGDPGAGLLVAYTPASRRHDDTLRPAGFCPPAGDTGGCVPPGTWPPTLCVELRRLLLPFRDLLSNQEAERVEVEHDIVDKRKGEVDESIAVNTCFKTRVRTSCQASLYYHLSFFNHSCLPNVSVAPSHYGEEDQIAATPPEPTSHNLCRV